MANTANTTPELIQLMQAAKRGDQTAFSAVYEAFYVPIFRYCHKRLRHLPDAEDVAQQVFLRLYTSHSEFSNQATSPLNYLYIIARHALADFWKTQKKMPVNLPEDFDTPNHSNIREDIMSQIASEQLLQLVDAEEKIFWFCASSRGIRAAK